MKKILVTGAAGTIGLSLIRFLLSEGKYEVTALDLKNKKVYKRLKRYRKRVNIVYGDVLDRTLIENLIKEHDAVIHLATCLPPLAEYKEELVNIIDYNSTENIVRAINYYNPKCYLLYGSSTSVYEEDEGDVKAKIKIGDFDYFDKAKYRSEELIRKKITNYTILRMPLVLGDLRNEPFIYNIKKNTVIETITKEDGAYAFCSCLDKMSKVNKKTFNIGGGEDCTCTYRDLLKNILKYHGINWNYVLTGLFGAKNYTSPVLKDSDASNKILNYRNDTLQSYYMKQKRRSRKRKVEQLIAKPLVYILGKRGQK